MQLKQKFFSKLAPWSKYYRVFKVLSVLQFLLCVAIPIAVPDLNTGYWMLSFTLFLFWLSTYALVRLAHHHQPDAKGFKGWFTHKWETFLFVSWLIVAVSIVFFSFKLLMFTI